MIYSSAPPGASVPIEDQSLKGLLQSAFPPPPPTTFMGMQAHGWGGLPKSHT